jgi:hypothetical protein
MTIPAQQLTPQRVDEIRAALDDPTTTEAEFREYALQLLADSDYWHGRADYWRESYRLVTGQSVEELNAREAVAEATRNHPAPCRWPHSPDCLCGPTA